MSKTLYYLGHFSDIADTFKDFVDRCVMVKQGDIWALHELTQQDVVVFGGGTDINPSLYNTKKSVRTHCNSVDPGSRDAFERAVFNYARKNGTMMLGICRGAQLLAALSGHALYQDISGHGSTHQIEKVKDSDVDFAAFPQYSPCISTHHQAVREMEDGVPMDILYHASPFLSHYAMITDDEIIDTKKDPSYEEIEIYTIPDYKILGIQGHPEYASNNHPFTDLSRKLFKHYQQEWSN
jgi:gamma-glutamyl-gamma-aminobutyrate hydrolase PuuD